MNLKIVMPVKEARHERSHAIQFHLYEIFRTGRFVKMDRRLVVAGERKWGAIVYGRGVSFWSDENGLKLHRGGVLNAT